MKPELFMRKEKNAVDLFAAFMNVNSMEATEQNFNKLRKGVDRAEKRIMKEVKMKRLQGVSVGRHPFFQKRGSFDGEKMVVALRIDFKGEGLDHYQTMSRFIERLGFKDKAMAIASTTNTHGLIEEFDFNRPTTHLSVGDVIKGITEDLEAVVENRNLMAKPLNRDRRIKETLKKDAPKKRGEMPPPTKRFKDKTKYDRKRSKKESSGMDKVARELVKLAKALVAKRVRVIDKRVMAKAVEMEIDGRYNPYATIGMHAEISGSYEAPSFDSPGDYPDVETEFHKIIKKPYVDPGQTSFKVFMLEVAKTYSKSQRLPEGMTVKDFAELPEVRKVAIAILRKGVNTEAYISWSITSGNMDGDGEIETSANDAKVYGQVSGNTLKWTATINDIKAQSDLIKEDEFKIPEYDGGY